MSIAKISKALGDVQKRVQLALGKKDPAEKTGKDQIQDSKETYNYPSLDLAFDLTYEQFSIQRERVDGLDNKANFVFGAATAVISVALILQSLPNTHSPCDLPFPLPIYQLPAILVRIVPALPIIITYVATVVIAYKAYKTRKFMHIPVPKNFTKYLGEPSYYTKAVLLSTMIECLQENEVKIARKATLLDRAFIALVTEAIALVLLLIVQVVCY